MKWNKGFIAGEKYPVVPSPLGGVTILWLKCLYHFDTLLVLWYTAWTTLIHCLLVSFDAGNFLKAYIVLEVWKISLWRQKCANWCRVMVQSPAMPCNRFRRQLLLSRHLSSWCENAFLFWHLASSKVGHQTAGIWYKDLINHLPRQSQ